MTAKERFHAILSMFRACLVTLRSQFERLQYQPVVRFEGSKATLILAAETLGVISTPVVGTLELDLASGKNQFSL